MSASLLPVVPTSAPELAEARIRQLEQELAAAHATNQQLSALAYHSREGRLLLDAAGTVLLVNDPYCQQWDLPMPASQWLGQPMAVLVALAMDRVADPAAYAAELAEAQVAPISQFNARLLLRNGRVLERDVLQVPLGEATGWLLCYRDVTTQYLTEQELRRVSRIPEENPNPILRFDAAGERVYANPAAYRYREYLTAAEYQELRASLSELATQALKRQQPQQLDVPAGPRRLQAFVVPFVDEQYINVYLVDITARHRAEQERAEQRAFYEAILHDLPAEVFVLDAQSRYQFVNPAAVPDAGLRHWMVGRTHHEYHAFRQLPAALAQQRQTRLDSVLDTGCPLEWVETLGTAEVPRYVLRRLQPVPAAAGAVRLVIGYGLDVTGREAAREQLREQQEFTQSILDASPSVIYVRDDQGQILFENRAMQAVRAATRHLTGEAVAPGSVEAQELAQFAANDQQVLRTGRELVVEETMTQPNGTVCVFQTVKRPLTRPDGSVQVLGVSTDITALKEAQHTLERSEKQYRDLMHYAQALICTYDLRGTVLSVNPALAALLNVPAAELLGQPVAATLPATGQESFRQYLAHMATHDEAEGVLQVWPRGEQEPRHLLYHNIVVRETGQAPYIISHAHDITNRVLAEQEMQRAREEAEATARARENFLANMSHEIRTPMNGVLGITAQLARTRLDARQQEMTRIIRASGQHLLAVLNDVLDMAKITAGKLEMEQTAFNICDSMGEALAPLALQAQEKGLAFVGIPLHQSCPVPWVVGDPHRLNQILLNLVSNAVKFTSKGSITVRGEQLAATATHLTLRFSVQDTGPGIAPDKQTHVFESFAQAYADTTRQHGGTGLGLSISRALVEQLGGTLTLESELGRGSTFTFTLTLPKAPTAAPPASEHTPATYDTGRLVGARVLLVEDNVINRTVARMLLEPWGVVLDEVPDGLGGLALLEQQSYDVVLMDIQMPGMSGVEVTRRLRQLPDPHRAATPVVALTANAFRADVERYLAAGLNACLTKPFDEADLYRTIEALLPAAAAPKYDLGPLRLLAQGRPVFVEKILHSFLANMPTSVQRLRHAAHANDWAEVTRLVHHIKPNLLALAVAGVEEPLALLEELPHASSGLPDVAVLRPALRHLLDAVEQVLRELPAELPVRG